MVLTDVAQRKALLGVACQETFEGLQIESQFYDEQHGGGTVRHSPQGNMIALTENPPAIKRVDVGTRKVVAMLSHSNRAEHVSWSPVGRRLASSDISAITKVWHVVMSMLFIDRYFIWGTQETLATVP